MEPLFRTAPYERRCTARVTGGDERGIRLDRTVFYPAGGGQPGDTGVLRLPDGTELRIVDTVKGDGGPDDALHVPEPGATLPATGTEVEAEIDWERRHRLMRMHTCLHLLCSVVPGGVTGGQVGDGKGRLDFDLQEAAVDKDAVTAALNRLIEADLPVAIRAVGEDELDARPELVRTMSVAPPRGTGSIRLIEIEGTDLQPCGGTHVARTGEIGPVVVTKIENKGRRNRRINVAFAG